MKKFLTVLLVIAVMFTFSFSSAFAASASAADAEKELNNVITAAVAQITYTGNYLKSAEGTAPISFDAIDETKISRTAVETGINELKEFYVTKIRNAADGAWDTAFADVATANKFVDELFGEGSDVNTGKFLKVILDKQVDIEEAAAYKALEVDLTLYSEADQKTINDAINTHVKTITDAVAAYTGSANFDDTINTLTGVKPAFKSTMDSVTPVTDESINVSKKLQELATDLNDI